MASLRMEALANLRGRAGLSTAPGLLLRDRPSHRRTQEGRSRRRWPLRRRPERRSPRAPQGEALPDGSRGAGPPADRHRRGHHARPEGRRAATHTPGARQRHPRPALEQPREVGRCQVGQRCGRQRAPLHSPQGPPPRSPQGEGGEGQGRNAELQADREHGTAAQQRLLLAAEHLPLVPAVRVPRGAVRDRLDDQDGQAAVGLEVNVPATKPKDVVNEAKEIIKFMEGLYGPFPFEKLDVAMMSPGLGFGQSPPAFVQLTGEALMSSAQIANAPRANPDFFHEFFSHEIAHQWWGHKLGWIASEDTWLSESYAEYSAGLYTMSYLGKDRYQAKMSKWKQNAQIGDPHGSIAWCNNVSGPQAQLWRTGLIYNKGPYVVHMLRMQMGLDNFKKAMQSVFAK